MKCRVRKEHEEVAYSRERENEVLGEMEVERGCEPHVSSLLNVILGWEQPNPYGINDVVFFVC